MLPRSGLHVNSRASVDKQKNPASAFAIFKNNIKLTIDLLSLCVYAPEPLILTYQPQSLREVRI